MKIEIHCSDVERYPFNVIVDGKLADRLTYDEMLGLVASATAMAQRPEFRCLQWWLKTPEQVEAEYSRENCSRVMPETTRQLLDELRARQAAPVAVKGGADHG